MTITQTGLLIGPVNLPNPVGKDSKQAGIDKGCRVNVPAVDQLPHGRVSDFRFEFVSANTSQLNHSLPLGRRIRHDSC